MSHNAYLRVFTNNMMKVGDNLNVNWCVLVVEKNEKCYAYLGCPYVGFKYDYPYISFKNLGLFEHKGWCVLSNNDKNMNWLVGTASEQKIKFKKLVNLNEFDYNLLISLDEHQIRPERVLDIIGTLRRYVCGDEYDDRVYVVPTQALRELTFNGGFDNPYTVEAPQLNTY